MLARRGLADTELLGDEQPADTILDEVAVHLRRKMRPRILEPVHDLEPAVIGESLDEARINHGTNLPAGYLVSTLDG